MAAACSKSSPEVTAVGVPRNRKPFSFSLSTTAMATLEPLPTLPQVCLPVTSLYIRCSSSRTLVLRFGPTFGVPSGLTVATKHCCAAIMSFISWVSFAIAPSLLCRRRRDPHQHSISVKAERACPGSAGLPRTGRRLFFQILLFIFPDALHLAGRAASLELRLQPRIHDRLGQLGSDYPGAH